MATSFRRLGCIGSRTKDLINGYIRECQEKLFGELASNNPYYNIPQLVNNHCMLFYELFTWYKRQYGDGIHFISDTVVTVIKSAGRSGIWPTCMFENVISKQVCDKFSITFKIKSFGTVKSYPDFYIGYSTGDTLPASIKNWNQQLGECENTKTSKSWGIYNTRLCISRDGRAWYTIKQGMKYALDDLLKVVFDFKEQKVTIYQNDKEEDSQELMETRLWIGLSFYNRGETVEMVEYRYY